MKHHTIRSPENAGQPTNLAQAAIYGPDARALITRIMATTWTEA